MLDGLGMAETTPGPLIMVTQFVGFMGALREVGGMPPLLAATLGGLLTTWVTFLPCFLWIFLGAPFIEQGVCIGHLGAAHLAMPAAALERRQTRTGADEAHQRCREDDDWKRHAEGEDR